MITLKTTEKLDEIFRKLQVDVLEVVGDEFAPKKSGGSPKRKRLLGLLGTITPLFINAQKEIQKMTARRDWVREFVDKFNFYIRKEDPEAKKKLENAMKLLMEEVNELLIAVERKDVEEVIDALGDIGWYCEKVMIQFGVDPHKVRDEIGKANLSKMRGTKKGREWSGGFDAVKPKGWKKPNHHDNHGDLDDVLS